MYKTPAHFRSLSLMDRCRSVFLAGDCSGDAVRSGLDILDEARLADNIAALPDGDCAGGEPDAPRRECSDQLTDRDRPPLTGAAPASSTMAGSHSFHNRAWNISFHVGCRANTPTRSASRSTRTGRDASSTSTAARPADRRRRPTVRASVSLPVHTITGSSATVLASRSPSVRRLARQRWAKGTVSTAVTAPVASVMAPMPSDDCV